MLEFSPIMDSLTTDSELEAEEISESNLIELEQDTKVESTVAIGDADDSWEEVARFLQFSQSHKGGHKFSEEPQTRIEYYLEKQQSSRSYNAIATSHGIDCHSYIKSCNTVEDALSFLTNLENKSPLYKQVGRQQNVGDTYLAFSGIPEFLEDQKEQQSELIELLEKNPDVLDFIYYLVSGKDIGDYILEFNIPGISTHTMYEFNRAINNAITGSARPYRNVHSVLARRHFADFIAELQNPDNLEGDPLRNLRVPIGRILRSFPEPDLKVRRTLNIMRKFLEISAMLDFHTFGNPSNPKAMQDIYPGADFENNNLHLMNFRSYYRKYFQEGIFPKGFQIAMQAFLENSLKENVYDVVIEGGLRYAEPDYYFVYGLRFLENILLSPPLDNKVEIDFKSLVRNRSMEVARIFDLIYKDYDYKKYC